MQIFLATRCPVANSATCARRRPPGLTFGAFLIAARVLLVRASGIDGFSLLEYDNDAASSAITALVDPCVTVSTTSVCSGGKLDYSFLLLGTYPGIDCLTYEAIGDVSFLGASGFEEWEQNCANMDLRFQGRAHPPLKYEETVHVVRCVSMGRIPVDLADWDEVNNMKQELRLSDCKDVSTVVERNFFQCQEGTETVCKNGALDYAVMDTQARPDCPAFEVRADVATRGRVALQDWDSHCANA